MRIDRDESGVEKVILHDNQADRYQLKNIAAEHPEVVERLRETELKQWLEKIKDPWLK